MPNVGGTGYYRFDLQPADWKALIASSAQLPAGEALATTDSLWASFRAGKAPASWLVDEAKMMVSNPDSLATADPGARLAGLWLRGMISPKYEASYRSLMRSLYAPRLAAIGFNPAFGAHSADAPDIQKLRQQMVEFVALAGRDPVVRAKLRTAADKYLAGDTQALDPAFLGTALAVVAEDGGVPAAKMLVNKALSTEDPDIRRAELGAAASSGNVDVAKYLLGLQDERLRSYDKLNLIYGLAGTAGTRDFAADWIISNYNKLLATGNGIFTTSRLPGALSYQCGVDEANRIQNTLGPSIEKEQVGVLTFRRTVETIRNCGILKQSKSAEIDAAIASK